MVLLLVFFAELQTNCTAAELHDALKAAAATQEMKGVLEYTEESIVSSDIIQSTLINLRCDIYLGQWWPFSQDTQLVR